MQADSAKNAKRLAFAKSVQARQNLCFFIEMLDLANKRILEVLAIDRLTRAQTQPIEAIRVCYKPVHSAGFNG